MKYLYIKHTQEVYGLNYRHEDGSPVKIGDVVKVVRSMAVTLQALGWGVIVDEKDVQQELVQKIADRAQE
jgi:hypothetical protein